MTTETSTDLVYSHASLEERKAYAMALSKAGDLIPAGFRDRNGAANPAKILLAAETGAMLQIHPIAALNGINIIDGKPSISPGLMSGLVRRAGHKLRVTTKGSVAAKTFEATAVLIRSDDPDFQYAATWNLERAQRAGLVGKGAWGKYFEAMCKARAISEVVREGAEDVLMGAAYVPEELGATVNESGEVIEDAEIVEESPAPTGTAVPRQEFDVEGFARKIRAAADDAVLHGYWIEADQNLLLDVTVEGGAKVREVIWARKTELEERAPATVLVPDIASEDVPF